MKTTLIQKEKVTRKWYLVDAKDKVLGRMATVIADKLRGKDKPIFSPQIDCGDFVIVINADKIKLTGKKMTDKIYFRHTGYMGGLKKRTASEMLVKHPTKPVQLAVSGMLPKNRLRDKFLNKLYIYAGSEHPHAAQKPEILEIK